MSDRAERLRQLGGERVDRLDVRRLGQELVGPAQERGMAGLRNGSRSAGIVASGSESESGMRSGPGATLTFL